MTGGKGGPEHNLHYLLQRGQLLSWELGRDIIGKLAARRSGEEAYGSISRLAQRMWESMSYVNAYKSD